MKGKIAYLENGKFGFVEHELPEVEKGAALVRVLTTNICSSDVKNWKGGSSVGVGAGRSCQGHEFVGVLEKLGEGVTTDYAGQPVKEGDRVVAAYYITCGECKACKAGRRNLCENAYIHLGLPPEAFPYFSGSFGTHYYLHPKQYFYKVPDTLSNELVAGANCAFSQVYFGLETANVQAGEHLLLQGAGALGLYAAAIAKEKGAHVIVIDGVPERLEMAKRFGADDVVDMNVYPTVEERIAAVQELTDGKGPDVALEATGIPPVFDEGIRHLAPMGRYIVIGINTFTGSTSVCPGYITRKGLTVYGVVRYDPEYLHKSLLFLDKFQHKYPFDAFAGQTYRLDQLEEALQAAADRRAIRPIIFPNG